MTTFSQIVTVLGAVGGIGMLAVMAGGPLLLDLPQPRRRTGAPPMIPQQRGPSDVPVGPRSASVL